MKITRKSFLGVVGALPLLFLPTAVAKRPSALPKESSAPPPTAATPAPLPELDERLERWQKADRRPIIESEDPTERFFLLAQREERPARFVYWGGSEPGRERRIQVAMLYRVEGCRSAYVTGYCLTRRTIRTFRADRVEPLTA